MCRRIIECIQHYNSSFNAVTDDRVEIDETHFRDSYKGYRKGTKPRCPQERQEGREARPEQAAGMHRHRHRRYGRVLPRGIRAWHARQGACLQGAERPHRQGYPRRHRQGWGLPRSPRRSQRDAGAHGRDRAAINRINRLHARIQDFMHGFKGVSTKHLQSYLAWFQWTEACKSGPPNNEASSDARSATACTDSRAVRMCACPCQCDEREHAPYRSDELRCSYQFD